MHFLSLSEDILLEIYTHITVTDLLSLKQTCRVLHAFGCTDYLWHQVVHRLQELILDIPPYLDVRSMSGPYLQRVVIEALRLDYNWRLPVPEIKRRTRISHGDIIFGMHLLPGSNWLITLSRGFLSRGVARTNLALWNLKDVDNIYRATSFDIPGARRCSAALQAGGDEATIAVLASINHKESLHIYTLPLGDFVGVNHVNPVVPCRQIHLENLGSFHEVHTYEHLVAASIVKFPSFNGSPVYQILFYNTVTAVEAIVDPLLPEKDSRLSFRLIPGHIVILVDIGRKTLSIRIHKLPSSMIISRNSSKDPEECNTLGPPLTEFYTPTLSSPYDFHVSESADFRKTLPHVQLAVLSFPSFHETSRSGAAHLHLLTLDFSSLSSSGLPPENVVSCSFSTRPVTAATSVCVGFAGQRAVWLEDTFETDELRLMKLHAPRSGEQPVTGPLLGPYQALPFSIRDCCSVAFDEMKGRVCLGLHTGDLHILDYMG